MPEPGRVRPVEHYPALPYAQMPALMQTLAARGGIAALALRFIALTAVRSGEARKGRWREFDLEGAVWTIPAERMKGPKGKRKEQRVPLSPPSLAILESLRPFAGDDDALVFPGQKRGEPLSDMSILAVLRRLELKDKTNQALTVHGLRSTFRDWAAEQTNFPRELAEKALAHSVKNEVEAAYQRGDLFAKRRKLMDAWAAFATKGQPTGNVLDFKKRTRA